jgi:hypothetical protein
MRDLRYDLCQSLVAREYFNAGRGDISQTSITQRNGEVGCPANAARSECMVFPNKREKHVINMGRASDIKEDSRGARGGAGARPTKAVWYRPEGTGLDRRLLQVDEASEDMSVVGEEPRVARRK